MEHTRSLPLQVPVTASYNVVLPRNNIKYQANSSIHLEEDRWRAVLRRDSSLDGGFVFGVLTTGVYCRPSCPARRPIRKNVRFYESSRDAEADGLRPCLRCTPNNPLTRRSSIIQKLCRYIEDNSDRKITLAKLSEFAGISRFHLQRIFTSA